MSAAPAMRPPTRRICISRSASSGRIKNGGKGLRSTRCPYCADGSVGRYDINSALLPYKAGLLKWMTSRYMLDESILELEARSLERIAAAASEEELEAVRVDALGRKGPLAQAGKDMGKLPPAERASFGKLLNSARQNIEQ